MTLRDGGRAFAMLLAALALTLAVACEDDETNGTADTNGTTEATNGETTNGETQGNDQATEQEEGAEQQQDGDGQQFQPTYGLAPGGDPEPGPTEAAVGEEAASAIFESTVGEEASEDVIADWNIDITPDGEGLPEGSGSVSDGASVYETNCARCHGADGLGTDLAPQLVLGEENQDPGTWEDGEPRTVANYWPYLTTYIDYIRRAMPFDNPDAFTAGDLSSDDLYAVVAWILNQNGMVEDDATLDPETVMDMNELPNLPSFFACYPEECRPAEALQGDGGGN